MTEYEPKGVGRNSYRWSPNYHKNETKRITRSSVTAQQYEDFLDELDNDLEIERDYDVDDEMEMEIQWEMKGDPIHLQGEINVYLDGEHQFESELLKKSNLEDAVMNNLESPDREDYDNDIGGHERMWK